MEELNSNSKVTIDNVDVSSQFEQNNMTGATASQLCEKFESILCRKRHHRLKSLIKRDPSAGQLIDDLLTILVGDQLPSRDEISKCNQTSGHSLTSGQKEVPPHRPSKVEQSGVGVAADDEQLLKFMTLKHVTTDAAALDHENGKKLEMIAAKTDSLITATSNLRKVDGGRPIKYWRQILRINVDKKENKENGRPKNDQKQVSTTTISFEMKKFYDKVIGTQDIYPRVDGEFQ